MDERELQQSLASLELLRTQLQSLAEQQQIIQLSLEENSRAKETLLSLKDAPVDSDILVPIGGSSFAFTKVGSNSRVIIGVGSGISIEKPIDEAVKMIDSRIKEMVETFNKLGERRSSIETQNSKLSQQVQQEYQRMQKRS
ncbi:MAG: prefoldin subunit alpha [Methanomassiliicoccales archaeon]|jgi:prefoldin alpha subunit|nr:prefoldin subunit alpha [Methanomassiliicoccales archaeon]